MNINLEHQNELDEIRDYTPNDSVTKYIDFEFIPSVATIASALVLPISMYGTARANRDKDSVDGRNTYDGGVYGPDGQLRPESVHVSMQAPHRPVPSTAEEPTAELSGTHLFGGILFWHFGHLIVDSLSRLWAVDQLPPGGQIVFLFYSRGGEHRGKEQLLPAHVQSVLSLFGGGREIHVVTEPTRIERLLIPTQLMINVKDERIRGHEVFRTAMRRAVESVPIAPDHADAAIYVSRSRLPPSRAGRFLLEEEIERGLQACGYTIVYPETLSIQQQISHYRAAKRIIATEGSALHLVALAVQPGQSVAIIPTRRGSTVQKFARQIAAFLGRKPFILHRPNETIEAARIHFCGPQRQVLVPDIIRLREAIAEHRMIDDPELWVPPMEELDAVVAGIIGAHARPEGDEAVSR